jgi:ketosteroid isomerase-like protein
MPMETQHARAQSAREVVEGYYADISAGRYAAAAARFAPDATLWICGEGKWPLGGLHDQDGNKRIYAIVRERFPLGLKVTVHALTVEGERVAVEVESEGIRKDGRRYNNHYHYLIIVRDGLILSRREYLDTIHANDLLCGPMDAETL